MEIEELLAPHEASRTLTRVTLYQVNIPTPGAGELLMPLLRVTSGAPCGEDSTHEACFHTFPILSPAQVRIDSVDLGRRLRDAASREFDPAVAGVNAE